MFCVQQRTASQHFSLLLPTFRLELDRRSLCHAPSTTLADTWYVITTGIVAACMNASLCPTMLFDFPKHMTHIGMYWPKLNRNILKQDAVEKSCSLPRHSELNSISELSCVIIRIDSSAFTPTIAGC
jgi:hypothetical protein